MSVISHHNLEEINEGQATRLATNVTYPQPKAGVGLKTICVDLDGTLAEPTWPKPEVGAPIQSMVDAVIEAHRDGWEIVIFTSRPDTHIPGIRAWLDACGLGNVVYDIITGKPRAAAYWDDRAVTFPEAFRSNGRIMRSRWATTATHPWVPSCYEAGCVEVS